MLVSGVRVFYM